ncbi:MAG: hypothetical protein DMF63_02010 [Acidobacteria bacterium]|nr:MAG: hypothetical protein DMF63_02010 [Acidobacteriota bacterium]
MLRISLVIALVFFIGVAGDVYAQDARTQELVAALDKTKYKKKEKKNISIEFYIDIKNEAAVRAPSEYSGGYDAGVDGTALKLQVESSGLASGSGYDSFIGDRRQNFTLKDAVITGARLTGTKVYWNGEERPFEAVFVNRTIRTGKNADSITSEDVKFGIGFIEDNTSLYKDANRPIDWTNRVFLIRR